MKLTPIESFGATLFHGVTWPVLTFRREIRVYGMAHPPDGREVEFVKKSPVDPRPDARFTLRAVKIFIDGKQTTTGTTWENYYTLNPSAPSVIDRMMFRVRDGGGPFGGGYLIDNVVVKSS